jgi:hypothetical protein
MAEVKVTDKDAIITRLRKALDEATDVGIYPQAWKGAYEKRTEYMEGWNEHAKAALKAASAELQPGDWE